MRRWQLLSAGDQAREAGLPQMHGGWCGHEYGRRSAYRGKRQTLRRAGGRRADQERRHPSPLYRQQADLERDYNIELSRSTLNAAVMAAGELLLPVVSVMKRDLLEGGYIQADETKVGVQSKETKGRNHQGYEFQYSGPGGQVVFDFRMSRAREGQAEFLGAYGGILQCDGYQGYEKIGAQGMVRAVALRMLVESLMTPLSWTTRIDRPLPCTAHGQTLCRGKGSSPS